MLNNKNVARALVILLAVASQSLPTGFAYPGNYSGCLDYCDDRSEYCLDESRSLEANNACFMDWVACYDVCWIQYPAMGWNTTPWHLVIQRP
jgi:hypothetical protein